MSAISNEAQWFEDNSTIMDAHKKKNVVGISYNTVNVAGESGDASPSTPIGINLPNANWIRATMVQNQFLWVIYYMHTVKQVLQGG